MLVFDYNVFFYFLHKLQIIFVFEATSRYLTTLGLLLSSERLFQLWIGRLLKNQTKRKHKTKGI